MSTTIAYSILSWAAVIAAKIGVVSVPFGCAVAGFMACVAIHLSDR